MQYDGNMKCDIIRFELKMSLEGQICIKELSGLGMIEVFK